MSASHRTYRVKADGSRVDGVILMAFIHNWDYHLVPISVFQDGMIDCWGLVDLETFKTKVQEEWVVTQPPAGAKIDVYPIAQLKATEADYWIEANEFIKEVADEIEELNGRPTSSSRCRDAWQRYQSAPSEASLAELKIAYESIPEHNRRYVLHDQDFKDHAIRRVLYPQEYNAHNELYLDGGDSSSGQSRRCGPK